MKKPPLPFCARFHPLLEDLEERHLFSISPLVGLALPIWPGNLVTAAPLTAEEPVAAGSGLVITANLAARLEANPTMALAATVPATASVVDAVLPKVEGTAAPLTAEEPVAAGSGPVIAANLEARLEADPTTALTATVPATAPVVELVLPKIVRTEMPFTAEKPVAAVPEPIIAFNLEVQLEANPTTAPAAAAPVTARVVDLVLPGNLEEDGGTEKTVTAQEPVAIVFVPITVATLEVHWVSSTTAVEPTSDPSPLLTLAEPEFALVAEPVLPRILETERIAPSEQPTTTPVSDPMTDGNQGVGGEGNRTGGMTLAETASRFDPIVQGNPRTETITAELTTDVGGSDPIADANREVSSDAGPNEEAETTTPTSPSVDEPISRVDVASVAPGTPGDPAVDAVAPVTQRIVAANPGPAEPATLTPVAPVTWDTTSGVELVLPGVPLLQENLDAEEMAPVEEGAADSTSELAALLTTTDPSGLAKLNEALDEFLTELNESYQVLLGWLARVGPWPWLLMTIAVVVSLHEVVRLRLHKDRQPGFPLGLPF